MRKNRNANTEEPSEGAPEWMTTYSDLVTLLLTFFILLFSMAVIDKQKFEEVAFSLRSTFMRSSNGEMFDTNKGKDLVSITEQNNSSDSHDSQISDDPKENEEKDFREKQQNKEQLEKAKEEMEKAIIELHLQDYVKVIEEDENIILRIDSVVLFDLGKADIKSSGKEVLEKMAVALKPIENQILVQGHTDNLPIHTYLFPTNWELSTKRATNVVLFLVKQCQLDPTQLTATGNGEFQPIAPNDTPLNRQKNRRIDIVIEKALPIIKES